MILNAEDLNSLSALLNNKDISLCQVMLDSMQISYDDYPIIDHGAKAPYVDLPNITFKVEFPLLYVYVDMQEKGLNIDNPQFISENLVKEYIDNYYFENYDDNILALRIKEIVYDDFNIDFHANKNTPSGHEILDVFDSYCIRRKSFKIEIGSSKVLITGMLTIYSDYM